MSQLLPVSLSAASSGPPWVACTYRQERSSWTTVRLRHRVSTLGHRCSMTAPVSRGTARDAIRQFAFLYGRRILPEARTLANSRNPKCAFEPRIRPVEGTKALDI
ncbi:hypothetical protein CBM2606_A160081 [Cupriavidus taiwanensis]|nr:hypothetical protein CBM2606_A160081 [Cupriavidus taiwanensis]